MNSNHYYYLGAVWSTLGHRSGPENSHSWLTSWTRVCNSVRRITGSHKYTVYVFSTSFSSNALSRRGLHIIN
jgi:hypothetical protein